MHTGSISFEKNPGVCRIVLSALWAPWLHQSESHRITNDDAPTDPTQFSLLLYNLIKMMKLTGMRANVPSKVAISSSARPVRRTVTPQASLKVGDKAPAFSLKNQVWILEHMICI